MAARKPKPMTIAGLYRYIRGRKFAVMASTDLKGRPQAAVVGIVVTRTLHLFFDTLSSTRKYRNLKRRPAIAFVIGFEDGTTLQYEGIAREVKGRALATWKRLYFKTFPDGRERERWPRIAYFEVAPRWARFSDFNGAGPAITEWKVV